MPETHNRSILTANDAASQSARMALFGRHFIYLIAQAKHEGTEKPAWTASAFLLRLNGQCFVMTAGHVLKNMQAAKTAGWKFTNFSAMDVFGGGTYKEAVPLGLGIDDFEAEYNKDKPSEVDVAWSPLSDFIVLSLQANKTDPINATDDMRELIHEPYDKLMLAGVPGETVKPSDDPRGKKLDVTLACLLAESIGREEASSAISGGDYERIYGQLGADVRDHLETIVGTSGGPVFGLWYSADGSQFRSTIIGIQSGWDKSSGQIAAWPIGYIVRDFIEAK